jgi:(2R)-3-sulfolactate dehydrogenase (NADP+)
MTETLTARSARTLATSLLTATGVPREQAQETGAAIVLGDLWGVPSHGLMRLPYYLTRLVAGGYDPNAELRTVHDTGPLVTYDGGGGLGHWQLWRAGRLAADRCRRYGVAAVNVANSGHCGALGVYTLPAVRDGVVALAFSNGPAFMPAWGGDRPLVSTSPVAAGFPVAGGHAIVDLALSTVARGKIALHAREDKELPPGWALDRHGEPTTDPHEGLAGMVAPLGGAKGFALAFVVEALTGGLVGPALSTDVRDMFAPDDAAKPQGISHLVLAIDPAMTSPEGDPAARLDAFAGSIRETGGRVPGSAKQDPRDIPDDHPVSIPDALRAELADWAERLGVPAA